MSRRHSAAFEAYVNRATDDERDYDTIAQEAQDAFEDAADSYRKGDMK